MSTLGAVYQINNDPDDNQVLISRILPDGMLDFVTTVPTLGRGTDLMTSDPFFSQNPVVVFNHSLFVVNAGSNSMSLFQIDPSDPTHITLQVVIDTNGDYPVSIAVNSRYVAVLNGGTRSGFRVFSWNPNGAVSPIPQWDRSIPLNPTQVTPPMGPPNTVSQIMFSPDNRSVIVAVKGTSNDQPGAILIYPISNNGLAQRPTVNIPATGYLPFSLLPIDSDGLLVTDASMGVITFMYHSTTGQSNAGDSQSVPITGAVCWSAYSPTTGNYYVIGAESGNVSEINVDQSNRSRSLHPTLVNTYPLGMTTSAADAQIATIDGIDYLYINTPGTHSVSVLRLDGPGHATLLPQLHLPWDVSGPTVAGLATVPSQSTRPATSNCSIM
jgi:hypothetical protein